MLDALLININCVAHYHYVFHFLVAIIYHWINDWHTFVTGTVKQFITIKSINQSFKQASNQSDCIFKVLYN